MKAILAHRIVPVVAIQSVTSAVTPPVTVRDRDASLVDRRRNSAAFLSGG